MLRPSNRIHSIALAAVWSLSGALVGAAVASLFQWSIPFVLVAVVVTGWFSWLGEGIGRLTLACMVVMSLVAFALVTAGFVSSDQTWSMWWLEPCAILAVLLILLIVRRNYGRASEYATLPAAVLEIMASGASLALALVFGDRVFPLGNSGSIRFLISSEDNAAWVNTVAHLPSAHAVTALAAGAQGGFGPLAITYLAFVREAVNGPVPALMSSNSAAHVVLIALALLIIAVPITTLLLAQRMLLLRQPSHTMLVWAGITVLLVSLCVVLSSSGFLTASLSLVMLLALAHLATTSAIRDKSIHAKFSWFAVAALIFGTGSAWVPLVPLAGAAIALWLIHLLVHSGNCSLSKVIRLLLFGIPTAVVELDLIHQYRSVVNPIGGAAQLIKAVGGTPATTTAVEVLTLVLFGVGLILNRTSGLQGGSRSPKLTTPVALGLLYLAIVLIAEAWVSGTPQYGPTKLAFVLFGAFLILTAVEVFANLDIRKADLRLTAGLLVGILLAATIQQGPIYLAAATHWPTPVAKPKWLTAVEHATSSDERVLCLQTQDAVGSLAELEAYLCSRWASSLQGKDDLAALTWRSVLLGRQPVSAAIRAFRAARDRPWRILVFGPKGSLRNPSGWWAPITKLHRIDFVWAGISTY